MKLSFIILFLLVLNKTIAQNQVLFGISDSCRQYSEDIKQDSTLILKLINRCESYSVIQEVEFEKKAYSRNGAYTEYFDTVFSKPKRTGFFKKGIETGVWKEYYLNGHLKYQGTCKIFKLMKSLLDEHTYLMIDMENHNDTTKIHITNWGVIDSLKNLAKQLYFPPYENSGIMLPVYYSLKIGPWFYYSESGILIRKEIYNNGTLVKSE